MLSKTPFSVSLATIQKAKENIPYTLCNLNRIVLNEPTGNFFYDKWKLKEEFLGTVWEDLYNSLPAEKGEARIIKLEGGQSYISHADIDDRWHLNISGINCFLIDLEDCVMHPLKTDGVWYSMNTGKRHTATNFGNRIRYQLVIRHLLVNNQLKDSKKITLKPCKNVNSDDARYIFDDILSPWLNEANKEKIITNFSYEHEKVSFEIDVSAYKNLQKILPIEFVLT